MSDHTTSSAGTGSLAPVNGLDLYYEIHGSGRPLVLLHGGVQTIDLAWAPTLAGLAAPHQVIAVELQGHGHTADTDRPFSVPNLASDIVSLLDHLSIDQADLFGFSLGGLTAMQLAMSHPDRVGKLVVASIQFRPDGFYDDVRDPALFATSTRMPTEADFATMRAAHAATNPDPDHFPVFFERLGAAVGSFQGWSPDALEALPAPTLVIAGDHDFVRLDHAIEMFELIPDAQLAVFPGTTHMGVLQDADRVLSTVLPFLADPAT